MRPTVLIADDDVELRDLYRQYLGIHGFAVETAADGLECLACLRRMKRAAVVLDIDLPWCLGGVEHSAVRQGSVLFGVSVVLGVSEEDRPLRPAPMRMLRRPFALSAMLEAVARRSPRSATTCRRFPRKLALPSRVR